jgi:hypothetical protein
MPQFGGKNEKKTSSDSKRHFTVVMGNKEHGLYVSTTPSSAAKKAVTKLCAANKGKKVEFHIREITQGSKKKTYGPYVGYVEKLKEPIQLKGRVIKHKSVAKLSEKTGKKMRGGDGVSTKNALNAEIGNKTRELFEPEITKEIITKESLRENANKLAKNTQRLKNNLKSLNPNLNLESKNNGPKNASLPQSNGPKNASSP